LISKICDEAEECHRYWSNFPGKKERFFPSTIKNCRELFNIVVIRKIIRTDISKLRAIEVPIAFKKHQEDYNQHRENLIMAIQELKTTAIL